MKSSQDENYVLKQFKIAFKYSSTENEGWGEGSCAILFDHFETDCEKKIFLGLCFAYVGKQKQKAYHAWYSVREV